MKKLLSIISGILCTALLITILWVNAQEDRIGPVITFANHDFTYVQGSDPGILLEGVTALDAKDGDVSDTLMVESIIPLRDNTTAKVYYAAKDQANHITKASIIVNYIDNRKSEAEESVAKDQDEVKNNSEEVNQGISSLIETDESKIEDLEQVQPTITPEEEELIESEDKKIPEVDLVTSEEPEELQELNGKPVLELSVDKVTIKSGNEFNPLNYVTAITDDKDDAEYLYRRITIEGIYNRNKAGTYIVEYNVTDSELNKSDSVYLKLQVIQ